jgi:linoleate 10R-lipoxygenase
MKDSLTRQGLGKKYTFDKPVTAPVPKVLNTFTGIKTAFSDPSRFKTIYEKYGYGSILMFDEVAQWVHLMVVSSVGTDCWLGTMVIRQWYISIDICFVMCADRKLQVLHALFPEKDSLQQNAAWFAAAVRDKIKEKSWQYVARVIHCHSYLC